MTKKELAELRGEIFGLKIVLMSCLTQVAGTAPDPVRHLDNTRREALEGILKATPASIPPAHLRAFQDAAAGIVVQATEAAKVPHTPVPPRNQRQ